MEVMELFLAKVPHDKLHMHTPFLDAIEVGNLPVVEWLWLRGRPHIDIHWENDFMLVRACEQRRVDMVPWLLRHADFSANTLQRCLVTAACFGYLPLVKYLLSFGWTPSLSVHRASVAGACKHRQLETARWLVAQRDAPGVALNVLKTWSTVRERKRMMYTIYFENAEGNLGVSNALLGHLSDKLPYVLNITATPPARNQSALAVKLGN
jgi:hypothetical protein